MSMEKIMKLMQLTVKDDHIETEVFEEGTPQRIATCLLLLMKQHINDYHEEDFIWNVHLHSFKQRTNIPSSCHIEDSIFTIENKDGYGLLSGTTAINDEQYTFILGCFLSAGISYSIECYLVSILYRIFLSVNNPIIDHPL